MTTLKVDGDVHNQLMKELKKYITKSKHRAVCYISGVDKKGIVRRIYALKEAEGGCSMMPRIVESAIAEKVTRIVKRGLSPDVFIRVGIHRTEGTHEYGFGYFDLRKLGTKLISISKDGIGQINSPIHTEPIKYIVV